MKLYEIANTIQGTIIGDQHIHISSLSPIDNIEAGTLVFADGLENFQKAEQSHAAAILVSKKISESSKTLIQVDHPLRAFIQLLSLLHPPIESKPQIHPTAIIAENVTLGEGVSIGPYVTIESGCTIGENCIIKAQVSIGHSVTLGANTTLHPNVTIYDHCQIGERVSIHASSVIGSDGFGYSFIDGEHMKIPHVGKVIIEDDVEIGANSVVDRATLGATVIGAGTKIDNFVQIAHSVKLGKHNILCGFTGIAGSTSSGNNVIFAANVGVSDHVTIDNNVILGARAGVPSKKHLLEGNIYLGSPARPKEKAIEQELSITRIPIMRKNQKALKEKVENLSKKIAELEEEK
jgi:UDP-3-O-[3-hydroxymyristoyl] glucosamine N-acyltransferase